MSSSTNQFTKRMAGVLLVGTVLGGWTAPAWAQEAAPAPAAQPSATQPAPTPPPAPAATAGIIRSIRVAGSERLEPETVRSYANLVPGQEYNTETLDQALKDLYATELFADVVITGADTGNLVITVRENPVINRIVLEGNKRIKNDKIVPEIKLAPRQIYTRSKVRADVDRIVPAVAGAGAGAGAGWAATGAGCVVAGASWARMGADQPPRMVPTNRTLPIRLVN